MSRSGLQRLIQLGRIRVNARVVKPSQKIKPGDHITMDTPKPGPLLVNGEAVPLEILYEDEALLVLNKLAGIVVHPASGNWSGTLVNALLAHFQVEGDSETIKGGMAQPGLVHRLDKNTSGVMVIAKTDHAHRALAAQFEKHSIIRMYEALVWGVLGHEHGVIELAIGRDRVAEKKVSSNTARPQRAVTEYRVLQKLGDLTSHVSLSPRTGRTHQLRAHLSSLGCPILGDEMYGDQKVCRVQEIDIPRVMLHAKTLGFQHPLSGEYQEHSSEFPADMQSVLDALLIAPTP
jgi:23S rRNA pseudouridine1911/1915/1917 synthase